MMVQIIQQVIELLGIGIRLLRIIFAPKLLLKRLVLVVCLQLLSIIVKKVYTVIHFLYNEMGSQQHALRLKMKKAITYDEWAVWAEELDRVVGNDKWKQEKSSPYFEWRLIEKKTHNFNQLMQANNVEDLMWHLRKGLLRVSEREQFKAFIT